MQRVIVPTSRFRSEELSPGVRLERFYPGGKDGPEGEVLRPTPGGQGWSEAVFLGGPDDAFQMTLPDIRLPANQVWPLHWHDCWTAVVILEGACLIGDWWMGPGDVFIAAPSIEYGPLVIGPQGCRLFEIFARAHLSPGGYAQEYRDHPTLQGTHAVFLQRSPLNRRNEGRQTLPCDGVEGFTKGRLEPGAGWDLGDPDDPERGRLWCTRLAPGERRQAATHGDWHAAVVLEGALQLGGRTLTSDDYLLAEPHARVSEITAGPEGAALLEMSRTAV